MNASVRARVGVFGAACVLAAGACAPTDPSTTDCGGANAQATSPRSIQEVVTRLNALPKPVELACFVEGLARPLAIHASRSTFSLQPSMGSRSPRIFVFLDPLIVSLVPEGDGSPFLEFGEMRSSTHTLKGEIEFPVTAELLPQAPFEHAMFSETVSNCSICHADASLAEDIGFPSAFVSQALRPLPTDRVGLTDVLAEALACDASVEPGRCAILRALFSQGEVVEREFPSSFALFL